MDYHEIVFIMGRILYGGYFVLMGWNHFKNTEMLAGYAQSKGIRSPKLAVRGSGVLLLVGGLGILSGAYIEWAVLALVLFLVSVSFKMHAFWNVSDPNAKMMDMTHFMKNMALLGAALLMLMIPTPWLYAIL